jgi:hypothetical protein
LHWIARNPSCSRAPSLLLMPIAGWQNNVFCYD